MSGALFFCFDLAGEGPSGKGGRQTGLRHLGRLYTAALSVITHDVRRTHASWVASLGAHPLGNRKRELSGYSNRCVDEPHA